MRGSRRRDEDAVAARLAAQSLVPRRPADMVAAHVAAHVATHVAAHLAEWEEVRWEGVARRQDGIRKRRKDEGVEQRSDKGALRLQDVIERSLAGSRGLNFGDCPPSVSFGGARNVSRGVGGLEAHRDG
jgi:hypothetical protein